MRARGAIAAGLAGAAVALAGVLALHDGRAPAQPAPEVGTLGGVELQLASCHQWRAASGPQRHATVRALAGTVGGASTSGGVGRTLPEADAIALFDRYCATPATDGFVLYVIYARAAALGAVGHAAS